MNSLEVVGLLRLVQACSPSFQIVEGTPAGWLDLLGDIPVADASAAVRAHFLTAGPWIGPADIRRRVAAMKGLLPPDAETAYGQALRMNAWLSRRSGPEPEIHPAAIEAARLVRWSTFDGPEGVAHRRFVDAYNPAATRAVEAVVTTPLLALEARLRAPKALPGGVGAGPTTAPAGGDPVPSIGPAPSVAETRALIARAQVPALPPPPRADYGAPTEMDKAVAADQLRRWAVENGHSIVDSVVVDETVTP